MLLDMNIVRDEMVSAKPYFKKFGPSPAYLLRGKLSTGYYAVNSAITAIKTYRSGAEPAVVLGEALGNHVVRTMARPVKRHVKATHKHLQKVNHDPFRKNGMGGRTWLLSPGRQKMVIVFHDANRAGPHIDVHIGRLSLVYRVKPELYEQLKYNRSGYLTDQSRKAILDHIRSEISTGARVPQNLDHSISNARASWTGGNPSAKSYGSGRTRQVVTETEVDIYKAHEDGPIEFYAPLLNPHRGLYLYKLYNGDNKRAPICIFGVKKNQPPKLDDRLHLKMINPRNTERIEKRVDTDTSTAKYDGASGFIVITPKGTTVWSPRQSVKTGEQIEYTHKLNGLARVYSKNTIVAMGEILFRKRERFPWKQGRYLSAAETGGVLNSNQVLPKNLMPEVRLYRVDRMGREKTGNLDFWSNRALQFKVASFSPSILKVVESMDMERSKAEGFEGVVMAPGNSSVNDGIKIKWYMDPHDWKIESVDFEHGEKGGIAGVIRCVSLESGKSFKLGPGSVGNRALTESMMNDPSNYVGSVIKVESRHGHEGRGSKVLGFHSDKGFAPV